MEDQLIDNEEEQESLFEEDSSEGNIITKQSDPEISSLYGKYKRGKLILKPSFQRGFVWDAPKASKLIESALLDIPIPMIYLAEEDDGKELVIDGQQRLTAFFSFIDGYLPDKKPFRLSGLKKFRDLIGKQFNQLDEEFQDKINYYQIRTITIKKESSTDLKFEIFERLNTVSVGLNDQELRNCIYRGKYNELLISFSENKEYQELLGFKEPHKRMQDVELVLRFAAFYHTNYQNYRSPMKTFINQEMEKYRHISEADAANLERAFKQAISIVKSCFGDNPFKKYYLGTNGNPNGHWEKTLNKALFDIIMFSFTQYEKRLFYQKLDSIREALINLIVTDKEFNDSISYYTNNPTTVKARFEKWLSKLHEIMDIPKSHSERCFSYELKKELYNNNSTCTICNQRIVDIDDAHIDHIIQYWKGGETIPENARLTHRFCNLSRALNN